MQGRIISGSCSTAKSNAIARRARNHELRMMVHKASNRSAVHGHKLPATDSINEEEARKEINKGIEDKENKRKEVEKKVDSQINSSDGSYTPVN